MKIFTLALATLLLSFTPNIAEELTVAPEISLQNPNGEVLNLSSLQGDVVLIDFWASWCKPCRARHPELVSVYSKFKDQEFANGASFQIFSVSLDRDKARWEKAIEQDGLTWSNHVSDLKGWDSAAAKAYGVRSIPHNVLLNAKGEIIAQGLHGAELEAALKSLQ